MRPCAGTRCVSRYHVVAGALALLLLAPLSTATVTAGHRDFAYVLDRVVVSPQIPPRGCVATWTTSCVGGVTVADGAQVDIAVHDASQLEMFYWYSSKDGSTSGCPWSGYLTGHHAEFVATAGCDDIWVGMFLATAGTFTIDWSS